MSYQFVCDYSQLAGRLVMRHSQCIQLHSVNVLGKPCGTGGGGDVSQEPLTLHT